MLCSTNRQGLVLLLVLLYYQYTPKLIVQFKCNNIKPKAPSSSRPYIGAGLNIPSGRFNNAVYGIDKDQFKAKEEEML